MNTGRRIEVADVDLLRLRLENEQDPTVRLRLLILNLVVELPEAITLERICEMTLVPAPTVYVWLRAWRERGYAGLCQPVATGTGKVGRPPALSDVHLMLRRSKLEERPFWTTAQVRDLIETEWQIRLSPSQVSRILRAKLGMHFGKPYPHDVRRPEDAEDQLEDALVKVYSDLTDQGLEPHQLALGFLDEASPQPTANTVRVGHFGHGEIYKNTAKLKANAIGFYAVVGHSVNGFLEDSSQASIADFFQQVRAANSDYGVVVLVLDNFSSPHSHQLEAAAVDNDIVLVYLPPYSPDLNPIEYIWKGIERTISINCINTVGPGGRACLHTRGHPADPHRCASFLATIA